MSGYSSFLVQGAEQVTNRGSYLPPIVLLFKLFRPSDTALFLIYTDPNKKGDDIWLFFKIKMDVLLKSGEIKEERLHFR